MCRFIESIRIANGEAQHLDGHQMRMNQTFRMAQKQNPHNLKSLAAEIDFPAQDIYKWRIVYDLLGHLDMQILPYQVAQLHRFSLMDGNHIAYGLKYEDRSDFEQLKKNIQIDEVIIHQNGQITDTTFSNLIFQKGKAWFTPRTYLLNGVMRQFLLQAGRIQEATITIENLKTFTRFQLINAMLPIHTNIYDIHIINGLDKIENQYR